MSFLLGPLAFIFIASLLPLFSHRESLFTKEPCPFCEEENYGKQVIYEDALCMVLYNLRPATEGALLVIPKRHIERFEDLQEKEQQHISDLIASMPPIFLRHFGTDHYIILQKNGSYAGQTVPHIHFHVIPLHEGESKVMQRAFEYRDALSDQELEQRVQAFVAHMHDTLFTLTENCS